MPPREYRRPGQPALSPQEREIVSWMKLGGSLWASAQLAEVSLSEVERWLESGCHRQFAREVRSLNGAGARHPPTGNIVGNVQGSNGQTSLLSWQDL